MTDTMRIVSRENPVQIATDGVPEPRTYTMHRHDPNCLNRSDNWDFIYDGGAWTKLHAKKSVTYVGAPESSTVVDDVALLSELNQVRELSIRYLGLSTA